MYFVGCPSVGLSDVRQGLRISGRKTTEVVSFSPYHIKGTCYQRDLLLMMFTLTLS